MHRTPGYISTVLLIAVSLFFSGCPPRQYLLVKNDSSETVKVDFTYQSSGMLLPHFILAPGESRRTTGGIIISVHDLRGRSIAHVDLSQRLSGTKDRADYYNSSTRTFGLAITNSGVRFIRP